MVSIPTRRLKPVLDFNWQFSLDSKNPHQGLQTRGIDRLMQDSFLSWYNMVKELSTTENMATEQAMATALEAERESLQSIIDCEAEAEQILEQARQAAHHISGRTDSRITRIHQSCNRIATDEVNRLQRSSEHKTNNAKNLQPDEESVIHAVTLLVESLTMADEVTGNTDRSS